MIEIATNWREAVPAIVAMAAVAVNNQLVHEGELAAERRRSQMCRKLDGLLYLLLMLTWWWWWRYRGGWPGEGLLCWGGGRGCIGCCWFFYSALPGPTSDAAWVGNQWRHGEKNALDFGIEVILVIHIEYHWISSYHILSQYHLAVKTVRVSSLLVAFLCWWFMVWQLSRLVDCRGFWPLRLQRTSPKS